jgi:hypothetical protein
VNRPGNVLPPEDSPRCAECIRAVYSGRVLAEDGTSILGWDAARSYLLDGGVLTDVRDGVRGWRIDDVTLEADTIADGTMLCTAHLLGRNGLRAANAS